MLFEDRSTGRRANLVFRPFCPGDGESFRRCIRDFYGDGYPYREYLEEDFLLEQCASGKMMVLCGVAEEGQIVSTSAARLDDDFQGSALLMLRVVKGAYRGMGVGRAQEERLFALVERREGLSSIYADVMTHDSVSQGSLARRGFVHCGIRLMLYRNAVMVSRLALAEDGKMSQAVMCRRGDVEDVGTLYCHSEHAEEVCRIYRKLGVSCGIEAGEVLPVRDRTVMSWKEEPLHHSGICRIRRVGRDFSSILEQGMVERCCQEDGTVLCYLNIKDEAAVYAYRILHQMGFFFTGLKPLQTREEYMLLAYIGKQKIRYEDIHLCGEGEELLSYIRVHRGDGSRLLPSWQGNGMQAKSFHMEGIRKGEKRIEDN